MNIFEQQKERDEQIKKSMSTIKHLVAVGSGKGGVGKSTVTANLALGLAKIGYKVGIADVDIYGPSIPTLFNIVDEKVEAEEEDGKTLFIPFEKLGMKIMSVGFFVDKKQALMWRGPMASNTLIQLLSETKWGELDYLLFDMPPGTGDIQLTLATQYPLSGALFVSTPAQLAVADVRRAVNMFKNEQINIPILGLVENMAYFTPKELPNNKYYIFGQGGAEALSKELDIELLEQIPIAEEMSNTNKNGNIISLSIDSLEIKSFVSLAQKIDAKLNK
jgi:ATPases involved in chromosome partitioning